LSETTAKAATPSPRPVIPRPSVVVAFMEIRSGSTESAPAIFFIIFGLIFIIVSLTMEKVTINEVDNVADFWDKILGFGVGISAILLWYWIDIRPIYQTKRWLESKLELTEVL